jgi:CRISPR-associated protein Csb1
MNDSNRFDSWLREFGPAALVLREHLIPVEGGDGVFFPPTFAASEDGKFRGGYNIDDFPDGTNVCLVDSLGSQANRMEPIFALESYRALVPQVVVRAGDVAVNLLKAGHRAGDAIVRCSTLRDELRAAFEAAIGGDAEPLARLAPTSLVFGVWDSRDTQAKSPRVIASTIRAYNVRRLTRSAQYVPALEYVDRGILDEPADERARKAMAERGFVHVPASGSHGGVIAERGIRRDTVVHLAALRLLSAGADGERTLGLRRYVLGLALTAVTAAVSGYLRQGCNLVRDPDKPQELVLVHTDGRREPVELSHETACRYATAAAGAFGVGKDREVPFAKEQADHELTDEGAGAKKRAGNAKGAGKKSK